LRVTCTTPLFNQVKKFKKKSLKDKLDLAYCGNNDYEICQNAFEPSPPPSPPIFPPFAPIPPIPPNEKVVMCKDEKDLAWCLKKAGKGECTTSKGVQRKCAKTCGRICVSKDDYDFEVMHEASS